MAGANPAFALNEPIDLLDRFPMDSRCIDPEELHFTLSVDSSVMIESQPSADADIHLLTNASQSASPGSKFINATNHKLHDEGTTNLPSIKSFDPELDQLLSDPIANGKTYHPRSTTITTTTTAPGRKLYKSASSSSFPKDKAAKAVQMRVKPKSQRHARELERNRQAAANYRTRQKGQLDRLLGRVKEEEDELVRQRGLVYDLKDELWHLRNQLMARQRASLFARTNGAGVVSGLG